MAFTIIDASGPVISAKISGELGKSEVSQIQAAALDAIRRCGKISALFVLREFSRLEAPERRLGQYHVLDRAR